MCPNSKTLSAYFDGELDVSSSIKIEGHLSICSICKARLLKFRSVKKYLINAKEPNFKISMDNVWNRLKSSCSARKKIEVQVMAGKSVLQNKRRDEKTWIGTKLNAILWKRRVSIPLPAAMIAACLIIFLSFTTISYISPNFNKSDIRMMEISSELSGSTQSDVQVAAYRKDLELLSKSLESLASLESLEKQGFTREVTFKLPEDSQFLIIGEPALLKAVDYKNEYSISRDSYK